jgi:cobalt-zinc-cadmium efflux system membrane fusion protein
MRKLFLIGLMGVLAGVILGFASGQIWFTRSQGQTERISSDQYENMSEPANSETSKAVVHLSTDQIKDFGIEVEQVGPAKLIEEKVLTGEIVLNPDRTAYIVPCVSGIAVQINKSLGDKVAKRQVMAVIDSRELADAKAGYLAASERMTFAQTDFSREEKLREKKISSEEDFLGAKQALAEAKINLRNAKQDLYSLGFDDDYLVKLPDLPDSSYTRYEICAPFDGTVIEKQIGLGEVVTDTSQIYRISDLNTVWAELIVYQKDLGDVHAGQHVTIKDSDGKLNVTESIISISPVIEQSTRTAVARVIINNPEGIWHPGTFVTGNVHVGAFNTQLAVKRSAIASIEDQDVVFIETDEGFEPQVINIGRTDSTYAEILDGLKMSQRYVSTNAFTLKAELSKSTFAGDTD